MGDQQQHEQQPPQQHQEQQEQQQIASADSDSNRMKRVILIRLPPGQQTPTTANPQTSPIPPNLISHIVNNELRSSGNMATQNPNSSSSASNNNNNNTNNSNNNNNNNADVKMMANTSKSSGDMNNTTTTSASAGTPGKRGSEKEDAANYKNYSPKQREWMLVYLGYARGLLNKEFEERLPDAIIQKTNQILAQRGKFCNINRTPSSKTLRAVWKNLWKEERTVATIIKKGGRPRIDPVIKREKRNERERRKRAAARELKAAMRAGADTATNDTQI